MRLFDSVKFLGWEPKVSLDSGLKETIKYFKNIIDIK